MCTLALYRRVSPRYPLIVVANRDEFLGRASSAPARWPSGIVAGRDLVAGGTWLGCRTDGSGRIVGILNRRPAVDRPASGPGERSRGLLCAEALEAPGIDSALAGLDDAAARRYGGFNLFFADLERACVVDNGAGVRRVNLDDGLSVLTNLDVNDPRCPRLAGATRRFEALRPLLQAGAGVEDAVPAIALALASHDAGDQPVSPQGAVDVSTPYRMICVHVGDYGTRSSTMIFVQSDGGVRYFHADGPPCTSRFDEIAIDHAA